MYLKNARIPILGFAAFSGVGKTTLLCQLIPLLKQESFRIGLIKHSHHNIQIDQPGKDSFRLREAGATPVMLVSSYRRAIITEFPTQKEPDLDEQLLAYDQSELDLILVEGFKKTPFPKIELHRPSLGNPLLYPDDNQIIAVASDEILQLPANIVALDINKPQQVSDYIIKQFLR